MRIALGTAQFGLNYGISNAQGLTGTAELAQILELSRKSGIDTLDTAPAYGESESVLGNLNVKGFRIVSKLPSEIPEGVSVAGWVVKSVNTSLLRLNQDNLHGILLHRPAQLFEANGDAIYHSLQELKAGGLVDKIGVSIYDARELIKLFKHFDFDLIQAPLSIFDQRLITSGWLNRLVSEGIEVHVRSIFLQGLLLMQEEERPIKFKRWNKLWRDWYEWLDEYGLTAMEVCTRYVLSIPGVERVIVGVQSSRQLGEILEVASRGHIDAPSFLPVNSDELLNPSRWTSLSGSEASVFDS